jgi:DDE family transposase
MLREAADGLRTRVSVTTTLSPIRPISCRSTLPKHGHATKTRSLKILDHLSLVQIGGPQPPAGDDPAGSVNCARVRRANRRGPHGDRAHRVRPRIHRAGFVVIVRVAERHPVRTRNDTILIDTMRRTPYDPPRANTCRAEFFLMTLMITADRGDRDGSQPTYNQRRTAEQWIKEGKAAIHSTRLSCHRFRANEVRLLLGVIATSAICCAGWSCSSPSRAGR